MHVTLIITTFNWPEALSLTLQSVLDQTTPPSKVIVADDGSSDETRSVVDNFSNDLPIKYSWQPDNGFRAARSRNLAVLKAEKGYLIFIDGDCLIPPTFIESHIALAKQGKIVAGGRFLLNKGLTDQLLHSRLRDQLKPFSSAKFSRLKLGPFRDLMAANWKMVRSCNFSIYFNDLIKISGFDEQYIGWGREDSDLIIRLLKAGLKIRSARLAACVGHLHHRETPNTMRSPNENRFVAVLAGKTCSSKSTSVLMHQ